MTVSPVVVGLKLVFRDRAAASATAADENDCDEEEDDNDEDGKPADPSDLVVVDASDEDDDADPGVDNGTPRFSWLLMPMLAVLL